MKFLVSDPGRDEQRNVVFRAEVDEDGDLMLYANGHRLLFITHQSGRLIRVKQNAQLAEAVGLSFDENGHIEIAI
jgi:hypothetical protein